MNEIRRTNQEDKPIGGPMQEIPEIFYKYFIFEPDDMANALSEDDLFALFQMNRKIELFRRSEGKVPCDYVVFNLDENIDSRLLHNKIKYRGKQSGTKIKDIAADIVDSILKAKGNK